MCCTTGQAMLKFPPAPTKSKVKSYTNSCISDYLACHIFDDDMWFRGDKVGFDDNILYF
ncbi:hypothetical protein [Anaerovorax odorimutans]|uniref:hypothetical protein n=1 Tax=Anaerovorax odorimutans TaxID=109327 RepID=UPI00146F2249|nr:hypothetical protein [Anaerovorax odorimutans]